MKKVIFILSILICKTAVCGADTLQTKSRISDVIIFFSGAQITRIAPIKVMKGKHLVMLDNLPNEVNPKSIQVNGMENCNILSVKHQIVYPTENYKAKDQIELESKIDLQELKIKEIKNRFGVFDMEEKLLLDNSLLGKKDEGSAISDIKEAADFYRTRLNEIRQGKLNLTVDLEEATQKLQNLYTQINEVTAKERKPISRILIMLECEKEINSDLRISYYVSSAGWTPTYDFRVDDISKPLEIVYNANIYQTTGEDWNNVHLTLSTNDPSLSGDKPELLTWHIGRRSPYQKDNVKQGPSALQGRVFDSETNEALPFANVMVEQNNEYVTGTTTDFDGQYIIKPLHSGYYNVTVSYIGYQPTQLENVLLSPDEILFQDIQLNASKIALEEFEVVEYQTPLISKDATTSGATITREDIQRMPGRSISNAANTVAGINPSKAKNITGARSGENPYYIDGIKIQTSNYISNSLKTNVTTLEYTIDTPYTIPSDGEDNSIKIKEVTLPVTYIYHAVPKLDNDVFLTAEIVDWSQLNLLSGNSNLYYQGTYTGESYIDTDQAADTLSLSLGRDRNIFIERKGNKEMFDKRFLGSSIKETIGWDITVKNNKNTKITIVVEDQFPVSEKKSIEVERHESSNAKLNDDTGKLTWALELEPNEKKILNFKYSVKYPNDLNLTWE